MSSKGFITAKEIRDDYEEMESGDAFDLMEIHKAVEYDKKEFLPKEEFEKRKEKLKLAYQEQWEKGNPLSPIENAMLVDKILDGEKE